jgi:branched-chain amino acid aminotransferase
LDAAEHRWVEELNAMNVMFVWQRDGRRVLSTPPLGGTILDGVTRDSLLRLAQDALDEQDALDGPDSPGDSAGSRSVDEVCIEATSIDALEAGAQDGTLVEAFACGTAAVVAPIGSFVVDGRVVQVGDGTPGPATIELRQRLLDVQSGRAEDRHGWLHRVERRAAG